MQIFAHQSIKLPQLGLFIVLSLPLFFPSSLWGQTTTDKKDGAKTNQQRPYSLTLSTATVSSFHRPDDIERTFGSDFGLSAQYRFENFSLIASTSAFQDYQGERRWLWGDASLSVNRALTPIGPIQTSGTISAIIPMSENNKDYRRMYTGVVVAPTFTLPFARFGVEGLSMSYRPSASIYFYEHEVALHGSSNTRYSLGQRLRLGYAINDQWQVGLTGSYARSYTYSGISRDSYSFGSSLGYAFSKRTSIEVGHTTQGNPLRANGIENELIFFNLRESVAYASISIRI